MNRRDRRTYERRAKKFLQSQMKSFRPTPLLSPRVHGKFIRRRFKKAPSAKICNHKVAYDKIFDACEASVRACSRRSHRQSEQHLRDRRWNRLFRSHLDRIHIRQPCAKHLRHTVCEKMKILYLVLMHAPL